MDGEEDETDNTLTQILFQTPESDHCTSSNDDAARRDMLIKHSSKQQEQRDKTTVIRKIMHVEIEENVVGGSIEHRLWPAAEYLGTFILNLHQLKNGTAEAPPKTTRMDRKHDPKRNEALQALHDILLLQGGSTSSSSRRHLNILELGAGVGLTGLELASQLKCVRGVLLTDLDSALPLLRSNIQRNQVANNDAVVHAQRLEWGNDNDIDKALEWCRHCPEAQDVACPLLILASDCVYWESLYEPLERTIAGLLRRSAADSSSSMCLLGGVRRWKRDSHFYRRFFGKATATNSGRLECTCIDEKVTRTTTKQGNDVERQVMRIYAVRWVEK